MTFRVDASSLIGSGHLIRCLTLARALRKKGSSVTFITRNHEGNLNYLIAKEGFKIFLLTKPERKKSEDKDKYKNWLGVNELEDAEETINLMSNFSSDWLVIDHYSLSINWENRLKDYTKNIMVIDDLANKEHNCKMLLNQNYLSKGEKLYKKLLNAMVKQLILIRN